MPGRAAFVALMLMCVPFGTAMGQMDERKIDNPLDDPTWPPRQLIVPLDNSGAIERSTVDQTDDGNISDSIADPQTDRDEKVDRYANNDGKRSDQRLHENWWDIWSWTPITLFTAIAAVCTVGILVTAVIQLIISRRSAERQLRAYVTLTDGHVKLINNNTAIEVVTRFTNTGQTPAYKFCSWGKFQILPSGNNPFTVAPPPDQRSGSSTIGAGRLVDINLRANLAPEHTVALLRSRDIIVYLWGQVDYVDAFGNPRHFIYRAINGAEIVENAWSIGPHTSGYESN